MKPKYSDTNFSVIIGSSAEGLHVARELRRCLRDLYGNSFGLVKVWDQANIFAGGDVYIESLEKAIEEFDFAILVLTADDGLQMRGKDFKQARDNVLFELGLFIGAFGRKKTFIFLSDEPSLKMPTDIDGISNFKFDMSHVDLDDPDFSRSCEKIGKSILERAIPDFSNRNEYFVLFPSLREDPFYLNLLAGISSNPTPDKDITFVTPIHGYSGQQLLEDIENMLSRQRQFAGGIIAPTLENLEEKDLTDLIDQFEIPLVLVDINPYRDSPLPKLVSYVGFDNLGGGKLVSKEMARKLGPDLDGKRVLILGNDDQRERHEGFIEAWKGPIPPEFEKCRFNRREAYEIAGRKMAHSDHEFNGIFGVSDEIALGATQAVCDRGNRTVVFGFDATSAARMLIDLKYSPLINTVVQDSYILGEKAIRLLKKMMTKETIRKQIEIIQARLYV